MLLFGYMYCNYAVTFVSRDFLVGTGGLDEAELPGFFVWFCGLAGVFFRLGLAGVFLQVPFYRVSS